MPKAVRGLGSVASKTRIWTAMSSAVQKFSQSPSAPETNPDILNEEVTTLLDSAIGPSAYTRDDELAEKVLQHFRYNLARMVDIAASVGAETIFITPASNLRDSRPFKSEHRPDLSEQDRRTIEGLLEGAQAAHAQGRLDESLTEIATAAALDPRHAQLAYLAGTASR